MWIFSSQRASITQQWSKCLACGSPRFSSQHLVKSSQVHLPHAEYVLHPWATPSPKDPLSESQLPWPSASRHQRFTSKQDVIRHYNMHKKRDNSLQHGFMRFSPLDDCSVYYHGCHLNGKSTHYHCMQVTALGRGGGGEGEEGEKADGSSGVCVGVLLSRGVCIWDVSRHAKRPQRAIAERTGHDTCRRPYSFFGGGGGGIPSGHKAYFLSTVMWNWYMGSRIYTWMLTD